MGKEWEEREKEREERSKAKEVAESHGVESLTMAVAQLVQQSISQLEGMAVQVTPLLLVPGARLDWAELQYAWRRDRTAQIIIST